MEGKAPTTPSSDISVREYTIAGILTHIYGLDEAASLKLPNLTCLWMLHPRLNTEEYMASISKRILSDYYHSGSSNGGKAGLITVTFDQRNHGTREVNSVANRTWLDGLSNPSHAPDMFSAFHGTAQDASLLMTYLPAYLESWAENLQIKNYVMGVSLGGHAAWLSILHEPRILGGVVIIGCANYGRLMQHRIKVYHERAQMRISKAQAAGAAPPEVLQDNVLFPPGLRDILLKYDPAGLLYSDPDAVKRFKDKSILVLSGADDTLVPHECQKEFIERLREDAYLNSTKFEIRDILYPGVKHNCTDDMVKDSMEWVRRRIESDWQSG